MAEHPTQDGPRLADTSLGGATSGPAGGAGAAGAVPRGYELLDEVGRGGMGVVYRARDLALGREVAVKVLQDAAGPGSAAADRFAAEARITARLQHPAIPPVHALGTLPDGRPFLAMKLIDGDTLDALLTARADPAADRGRFVAAFEAVCQAVGYAHSRGVLHRDLKPENVMVGSFGEVQVMDWGLAKLLTSPPREQGPADPPEFAPLPAGETPLTQANTAVGTPAYMSPEQARGATARVDERSDVFGLGAVLAVILTGRPPFVSPTAEGAWRQAAGGRVGPCFARLDAGRADPDLVALCKRCLDPDPAARPADGGAVAAAVAGLRQAAEDRARRAEIDRATAEVRARGERARRRAQRLLFAAGLAVVGLLFGGAWYGQKQRGDRERAEADRRAAEAEAARVAADNVRVEAERDRQERLAAGERELRQERARGGVGAALARLPDLYGRGLWAQAEDGLAAAAALLGPDGDPALREQVAAARRDAAFLARLDRIRLDKITVVNHEPSLAGAAPAYAAAFRGYGLDVLGGDPADLARRLNASPVREQLVAALDDWALSGPDGGRIFAVTAAATGQGWRTDLAGAVADPARLAAVYDAVPPAERSPAVIVAVGVRLNLAGRDGTRRLEDGVRQYPSDFWLHAILGAVGTDPADRRVGANRAALAVRPGTPQVLVHLGISLSDRGDHAAAVAALREAVRLEPGLASAHTHLGVALHGLGDAAGAVAAHREALRLHPADPLAHCRLASVLQDRGDAAGAAAAYREAVRHDPGCVPAHFNLGHVLHGLGDAAGAVAAYREAVRLDPGLAKAHANLGAALRTRGDLPGAVAACREAIRLDPKDAVAHTNLGAALTGRGDHAGAVAALREAARLDPPSVPARYYLGMALAAAGDLDAAAAAYRDALRLDPTSPDVHVGLAGVLRGQGRFADELAALRKAHDLGSKRPGWNVPTAAWLRDCERLLALDGRLAGVKAGTAAPTSPADAVALAGLAAEPFRREYAVALRLYLGAFAADPKLVLSHQTAAARAAVRVAAGDDPSAVLGWDEWHRLQDRAHGWLTSHLAVARVAAATAVPDVRRLAADRLGQLLRDPDLAAVRDPARLAAMPADERKRWDAFWKEVESVRAAAAR